MIDVKKTHKGRPILFLGLLLVSWVAMRAATWQSPWPTSHQAKTFAHVGTRASHPPVPVKGGAEFGRVGNLPSGMQVERAPLAPSERLSLEPSELTGTSSAYEENFVSGARVSGHNLLWLAAMAGLPMPRHVSMVHQRDSAGRNADAGLVPPPAARPSEKRWHADAWLLLREGGVPNLTPAVRSSAYGGNQAGAVVSFRLSPRDQREIAAYARVSKALVHDGESEFAPGLRLRPIRGLPVQAHAELRMVRGEGSVDLRPAAFLSGGVDKADLPLGLSASGYAQAGVVGGKFETAFADGALRIGEAKDRLIDLGLGAWGGAQRGASRLDFGPSLQLDLEIGGASATVSADYRMRVAGGARPGSGAALTIISGF